MMPSDAPQTILPQITVIVSQYITICFLLQIKDELVMRGLQANITLTLVNGARVKVTTTATPAGTTWSFIDTWREVFVSSCLAELKPQGHLLPVIFFYVNKWFYEVFNSSFIFFVINFEPKSNSWIFVGQQMLSLWIETVALLTLLHPFVYIVLIWILHYHSWLHFKLFSNHFIQNLDQIRWNRLLSCRPIWDVEPRKASEWKGLFESTDCLKKSVWGHKINKSHYFTDFQLTSRG